MSDDLVDLVQDQENIRHTAAAYDGFENNPGLVVALAKSGATQADIRAIGAFTDALDLSTKVVLARQSGVQLDLSDSDRAKLTAVGTRYNDVDRQANQPQQPGQSHTGFFGKLSQVANAATQLGPLRQVFHGLDRASDITNTVYRESRTTGAFTGGVSGEQFAKNVGEQAADMQALGYNPGNIFSQLAFASHGQDVFHPMDDLRQQFSPELVRDAQQYLADPNAFVGANLSDDELTRRQKLLQDERFQGLVKQVDARHISPGRDIAAGLKLKPGMALPLPVAGGLNVGIQKSPFEIVSGGLDATYSFAVDPTLVAGRAYQGAKAVRYGIKDLNDTTRIRDLMEHNSAVKRGWSSFLEDAHLMRTGNAEEASQAYARIHARTPELEPMLDEVYGGGLRAGKPIETYDDLVEHVSGGTALLRFRNGLAAQETPLMPGAVPRIGYRNIRANLAGKLPFIDLEKKAGDFIANAGDGVNGLGADVTGLDAKGVTSEALGQAALKYRRSVKGRVTTLAQRVSTLLPENSKIDLTSASGAEDVRRFAALYMPRSHANLLAARYATASVGERRSIAEAVYDQTMHAAGVPASVSGRAWLDYQKTNRALLENSSYDASGKDLDRIAGAGGETERRAALYDGQTSTDFYLPNPTELRRWAAKVSLYDFTVKSALESPLADRALGALRTSWLVSPSSAIRNGIENVLSAQFRGASADEIARSRAALSSIIAKRAADRASDLAEREVDPEFHKMSGSLRGVYQGRIRSGMRRAEHIIGRNVADDELMKRASELLDDDMAGDLDELTAITGLATRGDGRSVDEFVSQLDRGFKVTPVSFKNVGYQLDSADGLGGARYWGQQLGARFRGSEGVHVLRAVVEPDEVRETGMRLFRASGRDAVPSTVEARPQGVYFSEVNKGSDIEAARDRAPFGHGENHETHAVGTVDDADVLYPDVTGEDADGLTAGQAALYHIVGKKKFDEYMSVKTPQQDLRDELKSKFGVELGNDSAPYGNSRLFLIETLGAQYAKREGYKAIRWSPEHEFVALTPDAMRTVDASAFSTPKQALVDHLLSPEYATSRAKLERFSTLRDGTKVGSDDVTHPMVQRAAAELAEDQVADMRALVTGRNGEIVQPVVDELLRTGRVPKTKFLNDIADEARPEKVIQPKFVVDLDDTGATSTAGNVVQSLGDAAYNVAVARPLAWMSSLPIYHANYVKAYRRVESALKSANPEWDAETIAAHTRDVARQHAMDLTVQMIDNPRVRSQMALITRNVFNFWRAQEDFMRRWGRNLHENPKALRELQMAVEGGMHTGLVHKDDQGNLVFSYPGSGLAIQGIGKALGAFGMSQYQGLGVVPNMTTKLQFLNAGLDRPFIPTTSPVASIPLRVLEHFTGDQVKMIQAREITEGTIGASRSWYAQFLPSPVYRFLQASSKDDQEGQVASAARNAMLNLYAADPDGSKGLVPKPDATPDEVDAFKKRIMTGVRNQLAARAVLALFLPGAPSVPNEETDDSRSGKLESAAFNTVSLKQEFSQYVNQYGYQRALALWTKSHPDDLIYTVGTTQGAGGTGGNLAPTDEVLNWMQSNPELVSNFPSLAAYFAPDGPGDFSNDAWRAELELGLRQHKDLSTFYRDIAVKNAETKYYAYKDAKDRAVGEALGAGDDDQAAAIKQGFSDWLDTFKAANPLLLEKWQQTDASKTRIAELVRAVGDLTNSPLAKQLDPKGDLALIVQAYNAKKQYDDTHDARSADEKAQQDAVNTGYLQYIAQRLESSPQLIPLYQGVFGKLE